MTSCPCACIHRLNSFHRSFHTYPISSTCWGYTKNLESHLKGLPLGGQRRKTNKGPVPSALVERNSGSLGSLVDRQATGSTRSRGGFLRWADTAVGSGSMSRPHQEKNQQVQMFRRGEGDSSSSGVGRPHVDTHKHHRCGLCILPTGLWTLAHRWHFLPLWGPQYPTMGLIQVGLLGEQRVMQQRPSPS